MVSLVEIPPDNLHRLITISYWEDFELFENYHIKVFGSVEDAVYAEYDRIVEASHILQLHYYCIKYNDQLIGYMVIFEKCLYSFAINIRFRHAQILKEWMIEVRKLFNNDFKCYLYNRNLRAVEFLLRNGMLITAEDRENEFVTLVNDYSCQN